jgi:hypothetical protein
MGAIDHCFLKAAADILSMNRMVVALFGNRAKAEPVQQRLVVGGFEAEIHDELRLEKLWFVPKHGGGVRVEVPAKDYERACHMLLESDAKDGLLREAIRCPECRSCRVDYPQFTRKSFIPNLVLGALATVGGVEKQFYCQDCHSTWPKEGTKASVRRPHMAPYYFIDGVEQTTLASDRDDGHHKAA